MKYNSFDLMVLLLGLILVTLIFIDLHLASIQAAIQPKAP